MLLTGMHYLVTSKADVIDPDDGVMTLREAVYAANQTGPGDFVEFDPSLAGNPPIYLNGNEIVVAVSMTITGLGTDQLTIDPRKLTRHFEVNPGATLTMSKLTLANGNAGEGGFGGAIYADGSLVLTDCVFDGNVAGAEGGAIHATAKSPSIALDNCRLRENRAVGEGGGISQRGGLLTLQSCEFSKNEGLDGGGAMTVASAQISDCRFELNKATTGGGGGLVAYGPANISNTDFDSNETPSAGGGLYSSSQLTLTGGSFADNSADWGGAAYVGGTFLADMQHVGFERNRSNHGGALFADWWRTLRMRKCSIKANRADVHGGAIFARPGEVEISESSFEGNSALYSGGALFSDGASVAISKSSFATNTAENNNGGAIYSSGRLTVAEGTFTGNTSSYGGAIDQWDQPMLIARSKFEGNYAKVDGGAIRNGGDGTILNSPLRNNRADRYGGAIAVYADNRTTTVDGCLIELNQAKSRGGGIYSDQRRLEIATTTIRDNTSPLGGGVYVIRGLLAMTDSLVARNIATSQGGGIYAGADAEMSIANSTISDNRSSSYGGGFYLTNVRNTARFVNTTVASNRADAEGSTGKTGGGFYIVNSSVLLQNTIVAVNYVGTGTVLSDVVGTLLASSEHNLIGHGTTAGGLTHGVNGNLVGIDPKLGPLQDNGGPTHTRALLADSPAIDAGNNALALGYDGEPLWYDQRDKGFDRLIGLHVDIGAFEFKQPGGELHGRKWFDLDHDGQPDPAWGLNIVANGGFEDGQYGSGSYDQGYPGTAAIAGWQVIEKVEWIHTYWFPAEGRRSIDLNAQDAGAIAQALITEPGRRYRVQFAMAGNPGGYLGPKTLRVSAADTYQDFTFDTTGHSMTDMGWETKTWEFVAQDETTLLIFRSLSPGNYAGPALDNVVVQPYGRDDVRIYIDQNGNGAFDATEPLTFLRQDDPATPDSDETGTYRFTGLPDGQYTVRELAAADLQQIVPAAPGEYEVTISNQEVVSGLDFGNRVNGRLSGTKFLDRNGNGIRDRNPFAASPPTVLMVVDTSWTMSNHAGFNVPDMNSNGGANDVLDAELYAMLAVRQELVDMGWGATAKVGIIVFANDAVHLDMDVLAAGSQLFTTPTADADANGVPDVEQMLRSIRSPHSGTYSGNTDYRDPLALAVATLSAGDVQANQTTLFFCSDGLANHRWSFSDEVAQLQAMGVRRIGWTFGAAGQWDLTDPRKIDPFAVHFVSLDQITRTVDLPSALGAGNGEFLEPGMPDVTIYLDADNDGVLDPGETSTLSRHDDPATPGVDETGWYSFDGLPIAEYVVREVVPPGYVQTAPLNPDYHRVNLLTGAFADGRDFGNRALPGSISGRKGIDADRDGVLESGEPAQASVTIYLDLNRNGQWDANEPTAKTDAAGGFSFPALEPGE